MLCAANQSKISVFEESSNLPKQRKVNKKAISRGSTILDSTFQSF